MKKVTSLIIIGLLLFNSFLAVGTSIRYNDEIESELLFSEDFDPLVDINVTVEISAIRAFDEIEGTSEPDFFVKLFINEEEFTSPIWNNSRYVYDCWTVTKDVPQLENETIKICGKTDEPVIYLRYKSPAYVDLEGNCLIVQGEKEDLVKAANKALYVFYNIMK